jgi:DNA mismatch repair protein MLH1
LLYGSSIARELLHVEASSEEIAHRKRLKGKAKADDDEPEWSVEAFFTNANYHVKKFTFLLFINRKLLLNQKPSAALRWG